MLNELLITSKLEAQTLSQNKLFCGKMIMEQT